MRAKQIMLRGDLHRQVAIRAAMAGETIKQVVDRAVRRELERLAEESAHAGFAEIAKASADLTPQMANQD